MFRNGDAVEYGGEIRYIVQGPIMATTGSVYRISKCPPEQTVNERELKRPGN